MKLEQQVCTLEQAKRLKELGVVQKPQADFYSSYDDGFWWSDERKPYDEGPNYKLVYNQYVHSLGGVELAFFRAFTVAELLTALQQHGTIQPLGPFSFVRNDGTEVNYVCGQYDSETTLDKRVGGPTAAQAAAAQMIRKIESGELSVELVNSRLSAS